MAVLPTQFRRGGETAVASYSFTDIAEGTGVVHFYGFNQRDNTAISYHLTTDSSFNSYLIETEASSSPTTYSFNANDFNLPKVIKGSAVVSFHGALDTSAGSSGTLYYTITVQKVSGGVVTDLGSAITNTLSRSTAGISLQRFVVVFSLTQTHFKIGDNLRIKCVLTGSGTGAKFFTGMDPAGKEGTKIQPSSTAPTTFDVYIPFKIDL